MRYEDILALVGNTPHLRVRCGEPSAAFLYIKLEGYNPTGSIKDRAGVRLIQDSLKSGRLRPGMTLLDASSGNMGCAIAYFGRLAGYPAKIYSSSKLTDDKRGFMLYFGAAVEQVGDFTIEGNQVCRQIAAGEPDRYCFLDQLHSWANPRAHYETTGPEILAEFPDVAMLVGSLGSGGSLFGTAQFLKEKRPGTIVVAVQAAPGTRLPGTGAFDDGDYVTPFIQRGYDEKIFDHRIKIDEKSAVARTRELRDQGIFTGLQTGGVCHAAVACAHDLGIQGEVVALSGDSGWKNMAKLALI
ncbi:MAG: pyridoxal-phosphate dependent enzyme [Acidobacteria bacterium]|nr:pyridoxal-phosphate dependent enzyme [Acidobacteriota bacterium]